MLPRECLLEFGRGMKGFMTRRMFRGEDLCDPLEMEAEMSGGCRRVDATKLGIRLGEWIWRQERSEDL